MSKILFNEHQQRLLITNPNVASVSDWAIQYTAKFKMHAVKEKKARVALRKRIDQLLKNLKKQKPVFNT